MVVVGTNSPVEEESRMLEKDQDLSGPRFLHRSDRPDDYHCKLCSLPPKRTFDELAAHYTGVHHYKVMDYLLDEVRFLEIDEAGHFSERAKTIQRRHDSRIAQSASSSFGEMP